MAAERKLLILYGSQTGTAQDVAERVCREAKRRLFSARVMALDSFPISTLIHEETAIFVCATTGQGDPPDNMKAKWEYELQQLAKWEYELQQLAKWEYELQQLAKWEYELQLLAKWEYELQQLAKREYELQLLAKWEYELQQLAKWEYELQLSTGQRPEELMSWHIVRRPSVNNSLVIATPPERFNVIAKKLHKRLQQLGGQSLQPVGLADDQHDLGADAVIYPWLESLWDKLLNKYPIPAGQSIIPKDVLPPPRYKVTFLDHKSEKPDLSNFRINGNENKDFSQSNPFYARLLSNDRVTSEDHFQDVRLVRFDTQGSGISFDPGDVVMVSPQNCEQTVTDFISHLGLLPDRYFILEQNDPDIAAPASLPSPCNILYLCTHYLDINCVPRRSFFELLELFADDEQEKEKLQEFCSMQGQEELYSYCNRVKRTTYEVLTDFPKTSAKILFEYLFDLIPPLQPRAFSIASSQLAFPDEIHVLMAVVKYKTKMYKPRLGVCSTWLGNLDPKHTVYIPIWVKKGTISFPKDPQTPVIMVGPGTGCAPFRSLIQHRTTNNTSGNVMFFGCRNKNKDYFCESEWSKLVDMRLLTLFTAFSRDQEDKVYVQHKIQENGELLWDLINKRGAYFYLAGNAKRMPDDVKDALRQVIMERGKKSEEQANVYLKQLDNTRRYQAETWS